VAALLAARSPKVHRPIVPAQLYSLKVLEIAPYLQNLKKADLLKRKTTFSVPNSGVLWCQTREVISLLCVAKGNNVGIREEREG
jgi:hypothetical protein